MTPRQWQYTFMGFLIVVAALLQSVVAARLPLPGPPVGLVLAVVVAVGMSGGVNAGAVGGFAGGLLLDIIPPAHTTLGVTAFVLLLVGAAAGRIADPRGLAPAQLAAVAAGSSAGAWLVGQALMWLLGDPVAPLSDAVWFVVATTAVSLLVVPGATWALRRIGTGHRRRRARRRLPTVG